MFKTIWFDDNLNGKILKDTTGRGARRPDPDGAGAGTAAGCPGHHSRPLRPGRE